MPQRPTCRRLELEWLEPRVYLSAGRHPVAALALNDSGLQSVSPQFADASSAPEFSTGSSALPSISTPAVFVDLNGAENSTDGLLATFDSATGQLLTTVRIFGGEVVFVGDLVLFRTDEADRDQLPGASGHEAVGGTGVESPTLNLGAETISELSNGNTDRAPVRSPRPIVVLFPTGTIPNNFDVRASQADEPRGEAPEPHGDALEPPTRQPVVIRPPFTGWLGRLSGSPWWSRAVEVPGAQSRMGDLLDGRFDGSPDAMGDLDGTGSRVLLNSPSRMMAFTNGGESPQSGLGGELVVYSFSTGQLTRTGYSVSGPLVPSGGRVAFLTSEGILGTDLDGDGLANATVLQVFDPASGGVRNTGIKAEAIRANGGHLVVGIREAAPGAASTMKNSAASRLVAHQYDASTGRLTNLRTTFDAVAPRVAAAPSDPSSRTAVAPSPPVAPVESPPVSAMPAAPNASLASLPTSPSGPPKPGTPPTTGAGGSNSTGASPRAGDGATAAPDASGGE